MKFESVEAVLDFAIKNEQEAADFYRELASRMERPEMKKAFEAFAREELGHKAKLEQVKAGKKLELSTEKVLDLKFTDYLAEEKASSDMNYAKALVLAMQAEKKAFRLYSDLAGTTQDEDVRALFLGLAEEEAKHKLRFEIEYDDNLKEN